MKAKRVEVNMGALVIRAIETAAAVQLSCSGCMYIVHIETRQGRAAVVILFMANSGRILRISPTTKYFKIPQFSSWGASSHDLYEAL